MRRPFPPVHGGFSTISLLGVSTILLAAAGETMWHANAAASEGRWAAPTVGVAAAVTGAATSALAAEEEVASMTEPIFKPFVYVELPLPSGCTLLPEPGVHLNNDGVVVATMNNGSNNYGYIWYDETFTDGWQGPLEDGSGDIALHSAGLRGINDELEICGTRNASSPTAFFLALSSTYAGSRLDIGSGYANDLNNLGVVVGTSVGGTPVGWWDTATQPVPLPPLPGGDATNALGVSPNTTALNSLAVGQSQDANSKYQAVVWYYSAGWHVQDLTGITGSDVGFAVDINDDGIIIGGLLTSGAISDTIHWYYDEVGDVWTGVSLDLSPVFIPEAINNADDPEVVGGKYLWICTNIAAGTGTQIDLSSMSLGLPSNMTSMRCTDINDDGEIVGVGQLGTGGAWVAFKLVPYDVDNDRDSDVREKVNGSEADTDGNWLIDAGEDMRVGLHAPGDASQPEGTIDPVQIVRLRASIKPRDGGVGLGLENEHWIDEIAHPAIDCTSCEWLLAQSTGWGYGKQAELLIRVHSLMGPASFGDYEALPDPEDPQDELDALEDISIFAYRFAHCLDWLQWGNESFGGAAQYKFRGNEFDQQGECYSPGNPKFFTELSDDCQEEAIELVLGWHEKQMWAALRASALAGRPLRMASSGISAKTVNDGYAAGSDPNNPRFYLTNRMADWTNANQMYMDIHIHYFTAAEALDAIDNLTDEVGAPWTPPAWRICLEVGPKADYPAQGYTGDPWWGSGSPTNKVTLNRFFFGTTHPGKTWEDFIDQWEDESGHWNPQGETAGFRIDGILTSFAAAEFNATCWTALQYNMGTDGNPSPHLVDAMRATQVRDVESLFESGNYVDRFTPIKRAYELGAVTHIIEYFNPHPTACEDCETCPGCCGG